MASEQIVEVSNRLSVKDPKEPTKKRKSGHVSGGESVALQKYEMEKLTLQSKLNEMELKLKEILLLEGCLTPEDGEEGEMDLMGALRGFLESKNTELKLTKDELHRLQKEGGGKTLLRTGTIKNVYETHTSTIKRVRGTSVTQSATAKTAVAQSPPTKQKTGKHQHQSRHHNRLESESFTPFQFNEYLEGTTLGRLKKVFQKGHTEAEYLESRPDSPPTPDSEGGSAPENNFKATTRVSKMKEKQVSHEIQMFEKDPHRPQVLILVQAPVDQLILLLTIPDNAPIKALWDYNKFLTHFLVAFTAFMKSEQLLEMLIARWKSLSETPDGYDFSVKATILKVIREWMSTDYGCDFTEDIVQIFDKFVKSQEGTDFGTGLIQLQLHLKYIEPMRQKRPFPPSLEPAHIENILSFNPIELARQLTLMESELYLKIKRTEFLHNNWCGAESEKNAANLLNFIAYGNRITAWLTTEILKFGNPKLRSDMITLCIHLLQNLETLKNYNGMIHVLGCLYSSTISKLKNTWTLVNKKDREILDKMSQLMSFNHHYQSYHEALAMVDKTTPCIPLISVICSDIFVINDALQDETSPGWINWSKIEVMAHRIAEAKRFALPYSLQTLPDVQNWVKEQEYWSDENVCYEIATIRESEENSNNINAATKTDDLYSIGLSDRDWQVILTGAQVKSYQPGAPVLTSGHRNRYLYRVKSGALAVQKMVDGEIVRVGLLAEGATFGEISMLLRNEKGTITVDIVAATTSQVYLIEINLVVGLCDTQPTIGAAFGVMLSRKLANTLKGLSSKSKLTSKINRKSKLYATSSTEAPRKSVKNTPPPPETHVDTTASPTKAEMDPKEIETMKATYQAKRTQRVVPSRLISTPRTDKLDVSGNYSISGLDDKKFCTKFGIKDEVLLRHWNCTLKKRNASGSLFLSQSYLCFYAVTFGWKIREKILLRDIESVKVEDKAMVVKFKDTNYTFAGIRKLTEAEKIIKDVWETHRSSDDSHSDSRINIVNKNKKEDEDITKKLQPTPEDWQLILKGSRTVHYQKDEVIIKEGKKYRQLYQLTKGVCRIEKEGINKPLDLISYSSHHPEDSIFGEISFLEDGPATASVIADENVQIHIIEGYFLNILFQHYPPLCVRFYHYIARVLARRITAREREQNQKLKRLTTEDTSDEIDTDTQESYMETSSDDERDRLTSPQTTNPLLVQFQRDKTNKQDINIIHRMLFNEKEVSFGSDEDNATGSLEAERRESGSSSNPDMKAVHMREISDGLASNQALSSSDGEVITTEITKTEKKRKSLVVSDVPEKSRSKSIKTTPVKKSNSPKSSPKLVDPTQLSYSTGNFKSNRSISVSVTPELPRLHDKALVASDDTEKRVSLEGEEKPKERKSNNTKSRTPARRSDSTKETLIKIVRGGGGGSAGDMEEKLKLKKLNEAFKKSRNEEDPITSPSRKSGTKSTPLSPHGDDKSTKNSRSGSRSKKEELKSPKKSPKKPN